MLTTRDILQIILVLAAAVALVVVMRLRRRSHRRYMAEYSDSEVCPHLKPVLELLKSRGHQAVRAGQWHPDAPLEIHVEPKFDPAAIMKEMDLKPPVYLSDRSVLYCEEDLCELHPGRY